MGIKKSENAWVVNEKDVIKTGKIQFVEGIKYSNIDSTGATYPGLNGMIHISCIHEKESDALFHAKQVLVRRQAELDQETLILEKFGYNFDMKLELLREDNKT